MHASASYWKVCKLSFPLNFDVLFFCLCVWLPWLQVDAYKRLTLARLPPVLIFHLKRFVFNSSGSQKLFKFISYDMDMEISKGCLLTHTHAHIKSRSWLLFFVCGCGRSFLGRFAVRASSASNKVQCRSNLSVAVALQVGWQPLIFD